MNAADTEDRQPGVATRARSARLFSQCRDGRILPLVASPSGVIEWLAMHGRDEALGIHGAECGNQCTDPGQP